MEAKRTKIWMARLGQSAAFGAIVLLGSILFCLQACGSSGNSERGAAGVVTEINTDPQIESIVPSPSRIDLGESLTLILRASDPDGDELFYDWSADCAGHFDDSTVGEPLFTLDSLDAQGCTLSLDLWDARGATTHGSVTIATGPPVDPGG